MLNKNFLFKLYFSFAVLILLLLWPCLSVSGQITSYMGSPSDNQIDRIYQLSPSMLGSGSNLVLVENDTIRFIAAGVTVSLVVLDISTKGVLFYE